VAEQATALLHRDLAAHAAHAAPGAVARLLDSLRGAGADEQAAALLARDPAAHVALDDPGAVASLLDSLREAGAEQQATTLAGRLPGVGMFGLFLEQEGRAGQFRFGREADGSPSVPWGWENLDLSAAPPPRRSRRRRVRRPLGCPLGDRRADTPEHRFVGRMSCEEAVS
jgi:hypothetical protein